MKKASSVFDPRGYDSEETSSSNGFCNPFKRPRKTYSSSEVHAAPARVEDQLQSTSSSYTDADLCREMNALSFAERQAMEEDIHGVGAAIVET